MHKIAIIKDGIVTNIALFADIPPGGILADGCNIGDLYADGVFTPPPVVVPPVVIPQAVSMRQARLALLGAGKLSAVQAAIDAQSEPTKTMIQIEWDYATEVARNWPTLLALQPALGLTDADIDQLFIAASQL